jgi:uncharacterized DUF497 family protein
MDEDQYNDPFEQLNTFEWDELKREANLRKHGIDFLDVRKIFDDRKIFYRSDRKGESRYMVLGLLDHVVVAVAVTIRKHGCRLISARRASENERKTYHRRIKKGSAER